MIPKVIHFCWFGGKPYSPLVEECMATWKEHLPEYRLKRWDESNSPIDRCRFAEKAIKKKKWAFAADYVRLYAVYSEGGIYMDTDMHVLESFDTLLHHECFVGAESSDSVNCAIVGAVRNHAFIHEMLGHYESLNSKWILPKTTRMAIPEIASRILKAKGMISENILQEVFGVRIYPTEYFYPLPFEPHCTTNDWMTFVTPNSYAVHRWEATWLSATRLLKTGRYEEVFPKVWEEFRENPFQPPKFYGRVIKYGIKYLSTRIKEFLTGKALQTPQKTIKVSLIISTYNQPQFLDTALQSAVEQTRLPDEIIIADDGSGEETAKIVNDWKSKTPVKIIHVWQENTGFRLAANRNNGIAVSSGDFLIFLDSDCFLHKNYVEDYISFAAPNYFVCGTRVNIRPKRKDYILQTGDRRISLFSWGTSKKPHAIRSRLLSMLRKKGGMAGASFAAWKNDIERINGFNEFFVQYGGEDADIAIRLEKSGVKMKKMVHWGIAYHFDHVKNPRPEKLFPDGYEDSIEDNGFRCKNGLDRAVKIRDSLIKE